MGDCRHCTARIVLVGEGWIHLWNNQARCRETFAAPDNTEWLAGYRWALAHLTDPGVLRDAARYADERGNCPTTVPDHPLRSVEESDGGLSTRFAPHRPTESGATSLPDCAGGPR